MLLRAASLTVGQIADPIFRGVVIKSVLFTLALFVGLTLLFYWLVPQVTYFESDWLQWANSLLEAGGALVFFCHSGADIFCHGDINWRPVSR